MGQNIDVSGVGSVMNAIYRQSTQSEPEEGMGATILMWTDRYAATITLVSSDKKRVWVAHDRVTRLDTRGLSESQEYAYTRNYEAKQECYTLRKNGRWVRRGESMKDGTSLLIGHRKEYRDFSF